MKRILIALFAAGAVLAATLTGCAQRQRDSAAVCAAPEETGVAAGDSAPVVAYAQESRTVDEDDGDLVVLDTSPAMTATPRTAADSMVSSVDDRTLDQVIEDQLGHVPSYILAPGTEERTPEVSKAERAEERETGAVRPVSHEAETEAEAVEVSAADYRHYMDIDAYAEEAEEEEELPAASVIPVAFDFLPPALPSEIDEEDEADLYREPVTQTQTISASFEPEFGNGGFEAGYGFDGSLRPSSFAAEPASVSAVFEMDTSMSHSLSLEGFEDDSLEYFGRIAESLLEEPGT